MVVVSVHPDSANPHFLWEEIWSKERVCRAVEPSVKPFDPLKRDHVRFVCISDTHEQLDQLLPLIPPGDVLLHTGDFTNFGDAEQIAKFDADMQRLPHRHKIVIAGNHELGFEDGEDESKRGLKYRGRGTPGGYRLLKSVTYLQDSGIQVFGINVYGASWHPLPGYSFSRQRGHDILRHWDAIPADTDVLLTHTPPLGHMDLFHGERWGCAELLSTVEQRVQPRYHVFGHVHENNGVTTNGETVFVNASICNHALEPVNQAIVFDLPLPDGFSKQ